MLLSNSSDVTEEPASDTGKSQQKEVVNNVFSRNETTENVTRGNLFHNIDNGCYKATKGVGHDHKLRRNI